MENEYKFIELKAHKANTIEELKECVIELCEKLGGR